ncbi:MAG: winged helix-turn-helix domain-containing protein, partial [Acidimicrobiales bacterium]
MISGWADAGHGALAQRLAQRLRRAVAAGTVPDGARLPPERSLARALAVSRSTVTAALDELRADEVVESRQGSGTWVRG